MHTQLSHLASRPASRVPVMVLMLNVEILSLIPVFVTSISNLPQYTKYHLASASIATALRRTSTMRYRYILSIAAQTLLQRVWQRRTAQGKLSLRPAGLVLLKGQVSRAPSYYNSCILGTGHGPLVNILKQYKSQPWLHLASSAGGGGGGGGISKEEQITLATSISIPLAATLLTALGIWLQYNQKFPTWVPSTHHGRIVWSRHS
jgi:hypothetical protein